MVYYSCTCSLYINISKTIPIDERSDQALLVLVFTPQTLYCKYCQSSVFPCFSKQLSQMKTVLRPCYKHHLYHIGDLDVKTVTRSKKDKLPIL